ncbi:acetate--CoA ligase family protein [Candidatus Aminicenantes bacterium AC-334-K16]|jgi:acetyltransferase|nr:acetate--CoA ligase family protein [Candidatus Aminicenantes bacterium AC-334-K16]
MNNNLDALFYPTSVAVIGASRQPGSVGHSLLANLIDSRFQGIIYPVNPRAKGILGLKCYPSVLAIPDPIDLAVIIVPAPIVNQILEECGQKGIPAAVIISAGFKEVGGPGIEREKEIKQTTAKYGIALIGPNCLGMINTDARVSLNATFGTQFPREGNISFISQSGALCVAVLDYAKEANIGFAKFISMGNKAGLTENELLRYLQHDEQTEVILMYLEDLVNGREFMAIAREITSHKSHPKPIIALKAGRTLVGARAASSHTGSMAGSDKVYDAIFQQCGVLRGETLEEVFDYIKAFSSQPLPRGNNVVIVTNSGGPGILATDSCIAHGLNVMPLPEKARQKLRQALPPTVSLNNPIDLIAEAQADTYAASLDILLAEPTVHSALVILTPTAFTRVEEIAQTIVQVARRRKKPVVCCFLGVYDVSRGIEILEENGIPDYRFPESAARVLAELTKFSWWVKRPSTRVKKYRVKKETARKILEKVQASGRNFLLEPEAYHIFEAYGFPVVKFRLATSEEEAVRQADEIGYPVVLKIVSPDVIHKFDVGGVRLNLTSADEVRQAYQEILQNIHHHVPQARITGIIVEEMVPSGQEVILGMNRDEQFGPILMFGLGGIYVEALEDVTFRLAPIRELTASRMITQTKAHKILQGFRGGPQYDVPAIEDCLKRLSQLVTDFEEIKELDINPLRVFEKGKGCLVIDARIILKA